VLADVYRKVNIRFYITILIFSYQLTRRAQHAFIPDLISQGHILLAGMTRAVLSDEVMLLTGIHAGEFILVVQTDKLQLLILFLMVYTNNVIQFIYHVGMPLIP